MNIGLRKLQAEIEIRNMLVSHGPGLGFSLNQFHNPLCNFMLVLAMEMVLVRDADGRVADTA